MVHVRDVVVAGAALAAGRALSDALRDLFLPPTTKALLRLSNVTLEVDDCAVVTAAAAALASAQGTITVRICSGLATPPGVCLRVVAQGGVRRA